MGCKTKKKTRWRSELPRTYSFAMPSRAAFPDGHSHCRMKDHRQQAVVKPSGLQLRQALSRILIISFARQSQDRTDGVARPTHLTAAMLLEKTHWGCSLPSSYRMLISRPSELIRIARLGYTWPTHKSLQLGRRSERATIFSTSTRHKPG